jgi:hypothetical protein
VTPSRRDVDLALDLLGWTVWYSSRYYNDENYKVVWHDRNSMFSIFALVCVIDGRIISAQRRPVRQKHNGAFEYLPPARDEIRPSNLEEFLSLCSPTET